MRASFSISIYTLVDNIYHEADNNIAKQLADIYTIQQDNSNSPNFFYRGEVYILFNKFPLTPIYPPVIPTFKSYLKHLEIITNKKADLRELLKKFTEVNLLSDLFYVVPKEAFTFLEKTNFVIRSPEYIENIDKTLSHEINLLIKEQLLHTLLL